MAGPMLAVVPKLDIELSIADDLFVDHDLLALGAGLPGTFESLGAKFSE